MTDACAIAAGLGTPGRTTTAIRLACGVTMPPLDIEVTVAAGDGMPWTTLVVGGATTGEVTVEFLWRPDDGQLRLVELKHFFYSHPLTDQYRAQLAEVAEGRTPPHVFMLLIDEIVYWVGRRVGAVDDCFMRVDDVANLEGRGHASPFALLGPTVFRVKRDSRFLQWERGTAYYVTFGYWPQGESPAEYMQRVARFSRPGTTGVAPGDPGYQQTLRVSQKHDAGATGIKSLPPVLPGTDGPLRRFRDMDDYYARVLVVGQYGRRTVGRVASALAETPETPDRPQLAARPVSDIFDALGRRVDIGPGVFGGVVAPLGVSINGHDVDIGDWAISVGPDRGNFGRQAAIRGPLVTIRGPLTSVAPVVALADQLGRAVEGAPVAIKWAVHRRAVVAGGTVFHAAGDRFVPREFGTMVALGFHPRGFSGAALVGLLREADHCDQVAGGTFLSAAHPQFARCSALAARITRGGGWEWERPAPTASDRPTRPRDQRQEPRRPPRRARALVIDSDSDDY
jgi:hypothetical protein